MLACSHRLIFQGGAELTLEGIKYEREGDRVQAATSSTSLNLHKIVIGDRQARRARRRQLGCSLGGQLIERSVGGTKAKARCNVQGSAKMSADFVKQQPGRARQNS